MPIRFIVEDGTGLSTATSYVSESDADQIVLDYGLAWAAGAVTADKEESLNAATQYLDAKYNGAWKGIRTNREQALSWPRADVLDTDGYSVDSDDIPTKLERATTEAAVYFNNNSSALFPDVDNAGTIKREKIKLDVLEFDTEYLGGGEGSELASKIRSLLKDYINALGANTEVSRG